MLACVWMLIWKNYHTPKHVIALQFDASLIRPWPSFKVVGLGERQKFRDHAAVNSEVFSCSWCGLVCGWTIHFLDALGHVVLAWLLFRGDNLTLVILAEEGGKVGGGGGGGGGGGATLEFWLVLGFPSNFVWWYFYCFDTVYYWPLPSFQGHKVHKFARTLQICYVKVIARKSCVVGMDCLGICSLCLFRE